MELMSDEIWMLIFDNLEKFKDVENAYRTCKFWEGILNPSKSSWMFDLAFPSIVEYLSQRDILNCRSVCKKWRSGVDNFLENNSYRRPATDECTVQSGLYKTDFPVRALWKLLRQKGFMYNYCWSKYLLREEMMIKVKDHSGCPIVGKSIVISEKAEYSQNIEFLEAIGRHVWFLTICVELPPSQALKRILQILVFVPNIKMLTVFGTLKDLREDKQELRKCLCEFRDQKSKSLQKLPEVESLRIELLPASNAFKEYILWCISPEHLHSFHTNLMVDILPLEFKNLADLYLTLNSSRVLRQLHRLNSPIRRLSLDLWGHVESSILFEVLKHFRLTLRNFQLMLKPDYYIDFEFPFETLPQRVESFASREILADMKQLKRVALRGCLPPSLNFLLGMSQSLEYLHLSLHGYVSKDNKVETIIKSLPFMEDIDVIDKAKIYWNGDKIPVTYDSNVWSFFPKLKLLSMLWNNRNFGNRREAYEKFKNTSSN